MFILQLILITVIVVVFSNNLFKFRSTSAHSLLFSGSARLNVLTNLIMIQIDLPCKMNCALSFPLLHFTFGLSVADWWDFC